MRPPAAKVLRILVQGLVVCGMTMTALPSSQAETGIRGYVFALGPEGSRTPASGVSVAVFEADEFLGETPTDATGFFAYPLPAGGDYRVLVGGPRVVEPGEHAFEVPATGYYERDFELRFRPDRNRPRSRPRAEPPPSPGPPAGPRLTGRALLAGQSNPESGGYGLYSYLLFGSRPTEATLDRYRAALRSFLDFSEISEFEGMARREDLNILYLPVADDDGLDPDDPASLDVDVLLERYNYALASVMLSWLPAGFDRQGGPYIVATDRPLLQSYLDAGSERLVPGDFMYVSLSVPPDVVGLWVDRFEELASRERWWERTTREELLLELRTGISEAATAVPSVRQALATLVFFLKDPL